MKNCVVFAVKLTIFQLSITEEIAESGSWRLNRQYGCLLAVSILELLDRQLTAGLLLNLHRHFDLVPQPLTGGEVEITAHRLAAGFEECETALAAVKRLADVVFERKFC